ncbi:TetR/AcrR family transcriptional regulator [Paenibacillus sacheonensis]|uniref:TetR family transcriptional regulator n=1 Tax=Paenibacillus sacheonensis TaxID=742054 RepID=A0A7X4YPZ1_9BACL|nr:TetR/AcrR family transcriptional regulator [Paenibacillus sacheonensis]MBM7566198.1 AcrR family transcriptional regulator [Paenibacillus sacheonensis]NBC70406.1 TetR family transcriptional regulator [Paenibacillus sacheonensis]
MDDTKKLHVVATALKVFFKYGYKRVSMNDIAEAAGISRAGLYLYFKSKEDIFNAAIVHHGDILIEEIKEGLSSHITTEDKIVYAFEVWAIRNFDDSLHSPEYREITDSSYQFAREALDESYGKLETLLSSLLETCPAGASGIPPRRVAHLITGALRGFKSVAADSDELRSLVQDLLRMVIARP